MRHTIAGLVAGAVLVAMTASAQACGAGDGCHKHRVRHIRYFERLPDPAGPFVHGAGPRYYYVNQGPTFTGPGNFAPVPTYQERAVTGWQSYSRPYYYGYSGGPYADAGSHFYDGAPGAGAVVDTYRFGRHGHVRPRRGTSKYYYTERKPRHAAPQRDPG